MNRHRSMLAVLLTVGCWVFPQVAFSQINRGCDIYGYNGEPPVAIIGSPSGDADYFPISISGSGISLGWIIDFDGTGIWFYHDGPQTDCDHPAGAYQETSNPGLIQPAFSGYGSIQVAGECADGYSTVPDLSIPARSTDLDIDGDTDAIDKDLLRSAIQTFSTLTARFDFSLNGVVDTADYKALQLEMKRAPGLQREFCDPNLPTGDYEYDYIAPDAISNLSVQSVACGSVTLQWTAPGDDLGVGTCRLYQVRMSNTPMSVLNGGSAVPGTPPLPLTPGTTQSFTVSLASCTQKYFCVVTQDGANASFSNNVQTSTPPCAVTDLNASGGCTSITVSWPAPNCGASYDLRMSSAPISVSNPGGAVSGVPSPATPTTIQQVVVPVGACTQKYFAIRTANAYGAVSTFSNVAHVTTSCNPNCIDEGVTVEVAPIALGLAAPSPNPTSWSTRLRYGIPPALAHQPLDLAVFDLSGRRVRTLMSGAASAGFHVASWDLSTDGGVGVSPGVYLVHLVIGRERITRTLAVTR